MADESSIWKEVATWAIGAYTAMLGFFLTGQSRRIKEVQDRIDKCMAKDDCLRQYDNIRQDIKDVGIAIERKIEKLHERVDDFIRNGEKP